MIPHIVKNDRPIKSMIGMMGATLVCTLCSFGIGYVPFELHTHGNLDWALSLIIEFYQQGQVKIITVLWYLPIVVIYGIGWRLFKNLGGDLKGTLLRIGLTTLLLTPSIYINPPPSFGAAIADPKNYGNPSTEFLVLPAIVSVVKYAFHTPQTHHTISALALSFWPIPAILAIALFLIIANRIKPIIRRNDSLGHR